MEPTQEQLQKRYSEMPPTVKDALFSMESVEVIENLGKKYALAPDQPSKIAREVGMVLLRFTKPADFSGVLEKKLGIPPEKAIAISTDIQREIFSKVPTMSMSTPVPVVPRPIAPIAVPVAVKPIVPVVPLLAAAAPAPSVSSGLDEKNLRALFRISVGTNYTEDALREKFESLPQGLRQAIASVDTANAVQTIAKRYILHIDQMGALSSETGLVLLGLTHPRDFTKNLAVRLRISEPRALEIAKSVSEAVLVKVKETLRGLHDVKPPEKRTQPIEPPRKLNVLSEQAETPQTARLPTPAGVANGGQAKWNTGEEKPEREEILRGVENPRAAVGPTGWRPATQNAPTPLPPPKPVVPPPPPSPPLPPKTKSVLDEKLSQTVSFPREEKKYSVDPYREPIQ